MAGESIRFNASLNTAGFESGAKNLQNIAAQASAGIANHFGKIAGAIVGIGAAFIGVRSAAQAFNAAIAMGGKLNELSARTGETAGNLVILQRAFENAGAGADSVGPTINRLQRAIVEAGQGSKEQAEAFAKLGLNLDDLKSKTPTEQLQAVGAALSQVGNDSDRSALAMQLLGRSGGELIPLLRAMGAELDIARKQLGSTPEVMDRVAATFDTIGDSFAAIGQKSVEFAAGLLERLAPALAEITTKISQIDAAGFGQAISGYIEQTLQWINASLGLTSALDNIKAAIDGIMAGKFGEGLSLAFMTARDAAFNAINQIVAAGQAAAQSVMEAISYVFRPGSVGMMAIDQASRWIGSTIAANISGQLGDVLEAFAQTIPEMMRPLADSMANSFLPGVRFMGEQLQNIIDNVDVSPVSNALKKASEEARQSAKDHATAFRDLLGPVAEEIETAFGRIPKSFADSYKANLENPLIDMKDRTKETADAAERLASAIRAANFDAKAYAQSMRDARENMFMGGGFNPLGGPPESGETGMGINPMNRKFPWQGAGDPVPPPVVTEEGTGGGGNAGGGLGGGLKTAPQTPLEALQKMAEGANPQARAELMRLQAMQSQEMQRASAMAERGMFSSAARTQIRAEERAAQAAQKELERQTRQNLFGSRDMETAARNFEQQADAAGMSRSEALARMGIDRNLGESTAQALDRFVKEQAAPEKQRASAAAMGEDSSAKGQQAQKTEQKDQLATDVADIKVILEERLPIKVLAT